MSLIIVTPFNTKDSAAAARMLNWCADLSGQQPNVCVLAYEEGVPADDVQRAASRAFASVEHLPVTSRFDGWPGSANDYFAITAAAMRGRSPWVWLEGDCVMIRPQWLAMLESEYLRLQKPALGTIIPMFFERDGVYQQIGEMLAGVAVYHPNIGDKSPLLRSLRQYGAAYAAAKKPPRAFDSYLANDLLKVSASTPLIQHMGRSRNFRREESGIVCSYGPESRWSPVLAPETVLVHGCKDSSLIDLLRIEMRLPERGDAPSAPLPPIRSLAPTRKPATLAWGNSDALPPEKISLPSGHTPNGQAKPPEKAAPSSRPLPPDSKSVATLSEARNAIQHWPECKGHVFTLNIGKNDRYRVLCQCGAMSGKLPEGVDWEAAWEAQTPVDASAIEVHDAPAVSDASARLQLDGSSTAEQEAHNLQVSGSIPDRPITPSRTIVKLRLGPLLAEVTYSDGTKEDISEGRIERSYPPIQSQSTCRGKAKKKSHRTPEEQAKIR